MGFTMHHVNVNFVNFVHFRKPGRTKSNCSQKYHRPTSATSSIYWIFSTLKSSTSSDLGPLRPWQSKNMRFLSMHTSMSFAQYWLWFDPPQLRDIIIIIFSIRLSCHYCSRYRGQTRKLYSDKRPPSARRPRSSRKIQSATSSSAINGAANGGSGYPAIPGMRPKSLEVEARVTSPEDTVFGSATENNDDTSRG